MQELVRRPKWGGSSATSLVDIHYEDLRCMDLPDLGFFSINGQRPARKSLEGRALSYSDVLVGFGFWSVDQIDLLGRPAREIIDPPFVGSRPIDDLALSEEQFQLPGGAFFRVRPMDEVEGVRDAEITSDRPWIGF